MLFNRGRSGTDSRAEGGNAAVAAARLSPRGPEIIPVMCFTFTAVTPPLGADTGRLPYQREKCGPNFISFSRSSHINTEDMQRKRERARDESY